MCALEEFRVYDVLKDYLTTQVLSLILISHFHLDCLHMDLAMEIAMDLDTCQVQHTQERYLKIEHSLEQIHMATMNFSPTLKIKKLQNISRER